VTDADGSRERSTFKKPNVFVFLNFRTQYKPVFTGRGRIKNAKSPWSLVMDGWTDKTYLCAPHHTKAACRSNLSREASKLQFSEVGSESSRQSATAADAMAVQTSILASTVSTAIYAYLQIDVTRDRKCPAGSWNWKWFSCRPSNRMGGSNKQIINQENNDEKIQKTDRTSQRKSS